MPQTDGRTDSGLDSLPIDVFDLADHGLEVTSLTSHRQLTSHPRSCGNGSQIISCPY